MCRESLRSQELFLHRYPRRDVERRQRLALFHSIERRSHIELFNKTLGTGLNEFNIAFVVSDAADRLDGRAKDASRDFSRPHAQVLFKARTDRDLTFVSTRVAV